MKFNVSELIVISPSCCRFYHYGVDKSEKEVVESPKESLPSDNVESVEIETMSEEFKVVSLKDLIMNQLNKEIHVTEKCSSTSWSSIEGAKQQEENDENCTPVRIEEFKDTLSLEGLESDNKSMSDCSSRAPLSSKIGDSSRPKVNSKLAKKKGSTTAPTSTNRMGGGVAKGTKEMPKTTIGGGPKKEFKSKAGQDKPPVLSARYRNAERSKGFESIGSNPTAVDFHNLYNQFEGDQEQGEDKTNLFLYIDLHGHASKKGVFMYGNHLAHPLQAVECMLLPRLMGMNCHHFHFDACNFSERNMYHK